MGNVLDQNITDRWAVYNGDCMEVMPDLPDGSIHLSVYSPPFAGLYHYTSSERDLSNNSSYADFMVSTTATSSSRSAAPPCRAA